MELFLFVWKEWGLGISTTNNIKLFHGSKTVCYCHQTAKYKYGKLMHTAVTL